MPLLWIFGEEEQNTVMPHRFWSAGLQVVQIHQVAGGFKIPDSDSGGMGKVFGEARCTAHVLPIEKLQCLSLRKQPLKTTVMTPLIF